MGQDQVLSLGSGEAAPGEPLNFSPPSMSRFAAPEPEQAEFSPVEFAGMVDGEQGNESAPNPKPNPNCCNWCKSSAPRSAGTANGLRSAWNSRRQRRTSRAPW